MKVLRGKVASRFKVATKNLRTVEELILQRTGLPSMHPGTLNVNLSEPYWVTADAQIEPHEYFTGETLKLQRCRVRGERMFIMRPDSHEQRGGIGADVLELISPANLREAWGLSEGDDLEVEVEGDAHWWERANP